MNKQFEGKVIAVTGAASGIGLALTEVLASRGAKLAISDIQDGPLTTVEKQLKNEGVDVVATKLDVSSSSAVDEWIKSTVKHFGKLDGAANIAGIEMVFTNVEDTEDEVWHKVLSVNLSGVMFCVRAQIRVMGKGSSIVNAASLAGIAGRPGLGAYVCSKHGVVGLTKTVAKEVGPKGIRVNCVAPGPIETPMLERLLTGSQSSSSSGTTNTYNALPLQRKGQADEVAKTVAFLLSDESSYTTGTVQSVDGGAAA